MFPVIGDLRVDKIGSPEVLNVLKPIWNDKRETATKIAQRMAAILDRAKADGFRSGDCPVKFAKQFGLEKERAKVKHHAALPFDVMPSFMQALRADGASDGTKLALEFLILTAARDKEARFAPWGEINLAKKEWTIPSVRMKADEPHTVPLSPRCIEILELAKGLSPCSPNDLIFPGISKSGALSENTLANLASKIATAIGQGHCTAHGMRSTFMDWASERTHFHRDVREKCLAHKIKDEVEAAYRRGDMLEKRRALMDQWAAFATSEPAGDNVVQMVPSAKMATG